MNCESARLAMLSSDLGDLEARADSELTTHLAGCAECRAAAQSILRQTHTLDGALAMERATDLDRRRQSVRRRRRAVAGVCLAAGVVAIVAIQLRGTSRTRVDDTPRAPASQAVLIENAQGRDVRVQQGPDTINIVFFTRGSR